jgi:hypothetical protein
MLTSDASICLVMQFDSKKMISWLIMVCTNLFAGVTQGDTLLTWILNFVAVH